MSAPSLADRIDAALPQTQCTRCGYADCRAYAEAVATGLAGINQCPPGGAEGVARLAAITGRPPVPLNPAHGVEGPRRIAVVDEAWCIGCTLCIDACPVDVIAGAPKRMHGVLADGCTGCELCLPPCPMDCIHLQPIGDPMLATRTGWNAWSAPLAQQARQRYAAHRKRLERRSHNRPDGLPTTGFATQGLPAKAAGPMQPADSPPHETTSASAPKKDLIAAALERARQRQAQRKA
ncbi:Electron transport complex, RnfABCDGE type, B subunit [Thiomonas sp. X19]|uniref:electron transport complex subunit RsxB n=1 Tax=Thiomonas sp. X19 TaxID=1050370 RepID=UPI000B62811A|nr:electron transport complex subunit RsxB [Thiomonas sp. X19]SCC94865.1 Electron transport complex, RnfABCDGE type, B subunit [Thiomonas sp. X19]